MQLTAVIQHGALHLCGDTGTLHLGLMTGTPTVSWFRPNPGSAVWIPVGDCYRTVFGTGNDPHAGLQGIETGRLLEAVSTVLRAARPAGTLDSAPC
jgi:ADP-heptose:LPS heptosyltransferase